MSMPLHRLNQCWQEGDQPLGADVIGRRPRQVQRLLYLWSVVGWPWPWTLDRQLGRHRMPQESNGILACITCSCDKLIENNRFQCW